MGRRKKATGLLAARVCGGCGLLLTLSPNGTDATQPGRAHVSATLQAIYDTDQQAAVGRVEVDIHYDCSSPSPAEALTAAGLSVQASSKLTPLCVFEGWVRPAAVP